MGNARHTTRPDAHGPGRHANRPTAATAGGSRRKRALFAAAMLFICVAACALGVWQLQRRSGKLALIAQTQARIHAPPTPAPGPASWRRISATQDAYRRVRVAGRYDHRRETLVLAVTGREPGYWLMTPLRTDAGWTVLVNRGFVPAESARPSRPTGEVAVIGLLRISEPGWAVFRVNDPAADRWFSRDVPAIARARGLAGVAPYFIDADAAGAPDSYPLGGLTVVTFRNEHLGYALTWFAISALGGWAFRRVLRAR